MATPSQIAAVQRLSDEEKRLNIESHLLAELTKYGGERIVNGPPMARLIKDLADETERLADQGFLRRPQILRVEIRGDGPCGDCGTADNIIWFTDNVLWNEVMRPNGETDDEPFLCVTCFVARVDRAGLAPTGWRLVPDWHWETHTERDARRESGRERSLVDGDTR